MNDRNTILRKRVCFYGKVQAVGFRFQAQNAARHHRVTGWVKNEYDGSVTMEIQGTEQQINGVVAEIDSDPYIRIERVEVKWLEPKPDEREFRIKHGF